MKMVILEGEAEVKAEEDLEDPLEEGGDFLLEEEVEGTLDIIEAEEGEEEAIDLELGNTEQDGDSDSLHFNNKIIQSCVAIMGL
jgi:hypothetical protein